MLSTRYSCRILMKLEFSRQMSGKAQISSLIKIGPAGAELFQTDRHMKLIVVCRNFATAPKNGNTYSHSTTTTRGPGVAYITTPHPSTFCA